MGLIQRERIAGGRLTYESDRQAYNDLMVMTWSILAMRDLQVWYADEMIGLIKMDSLYRHGIKQMCGRLESLLRRYGKETNGLMASVHSEWAFADFNQDVMDYVSRDISILEHTMCNQLLREFGRHGIDADAMTCSRIKLAQLIASMADRHEKNLREEFHRVNCRFRHVWLIGSTIHDVGRCTIRLSDEVLRKKGLEFIGDACEDVKAAARIVFRKLTSPEKTVELMLRHKIVLPDGDVCEYRNGSIADGVCE